MFVAFNMVKPAEVREVWRHHRFHSFLMIFTAGASRRSPTPAL